MGGGCRWAARASLAPDNAEKGPLVSGAARFGDKEAEDQGAVGGGNNPPPHQAEGGVELAQDLQKRFSRAMEKPRFAG